MKRCLKTWMRVKNKTLKLLAARAVWLTHWHSGFLFSMNYLKNKDKVLFLGKDYCSTSNRSMQRINLKQSSWYRSSSNTPLMIDSLKINGWYNFSSSSCAVFSPFCALINISLNLIILVTSECGSKFCSCAIVNSSNPFIF